MPPTRADWARRVAYRLLELGTRADPDLLYAMGMELHDTLGHLAPEAAADAEWQEWPPHDD